MVDTRLGTSAEAMIRDIEAGEIDGGVLWGPIAGYYAKQSEPPLDLVPLLKEKGGSRMMFRITMGVRAIRPGMEARAEPADRRRTRTEIDKILPDYGVPLLDDQNNVIPPPG